MLHALVAEAAQQTEEHGVELAMPPVAFGIVALCILLAMLLVTWAFKNSGSRH